MDEREKAGVVLEGRLPRVLVAGCGAVAVLCGYVILQQMSIAWLAVYATTVAASLPRLVMLRESLSVGPKGVALRRFGRTRSFRWERIGYFKHHNGTAFMLVAGPNGPLAALDAIPLPDTKVYRAAELVAFLTDRQRAHVPIGQGRQERQ